MNEELMIRLMQDINECNVKFGTCDVSFTFHDGKIQFYEISTRKRTNVNAGSKNVNKAGTIGERKTAQLQFYYYPIIYFGKH